MSLYHETGGVVKYSPYEIDCRASLITQRAASGENIFRQSKQKTARIVDPMRRFFVTISERSSGGKDSVDSLCGEFLEMPCIQRFYSASLGFHLFGAICEYISSKGLTKRDFFGMIVGEDTRSIAVYRTPGERQRNIPRFAAGEDAFESTLKRSRRRSSPASPHLKP